MLLDDASRIILKKSICVHLFISYSAGKLCDEFLQQEFELIVCSGGSWSILSGNVFGRFFTGYLKKFALQFVVVISGVSTVRNSL